MRKHLQNMITFANNPKALAFTKLGSANGSTFYILVDYPMWRDDREYVVRTDMTLKQAQDDRTGTIEKFEGLIAKENELAEIDQIQKEVIEACQAAREELINS
jgi:hypothetical protein